MGSETKTFSLLRDQAPAFSILMFTLSAAWEIEQNSYKAQLKTSLHQGKKVMLRLTISPTYYIAVQVPATVCTLGRALLFSQA